MAKMAKIAPSSMAIFLSPTYRKWPKSGLLGSFFAFWDHFLGVRSHFFSKVLKEGIIFCDFGIIFWAQIALFGPKIGRSEPQVTPGKNGPNCQNRRFQLLKMVFFGPDRTFWAKSAISNGQK